MRVVAFIPEGRHNDVALRLAFLIRIDQSKSREVTKQRVVAGRTDATDLQVRAPRDIDQPVAVTRGKIGHTVRLRGGKPAAARTDADDKAVAR